MAPRGGGAADTVLDRYAVSYIRTMLGWDSRARSLASFSAMSRCCRLWMEVIFRTISADADGDGCEADPAPSADEDEADGSSLTR